MNEVRDFDRALEAHRAGALDDARRAYEQIIVENPEHAGAWLNLGALLRQQADLGPALDALSRACQLAPDHAGAQFNMGNALADASRLIEAADAFRRAVHLAPEFADAHNNLGTVLERAGKSEEAIATFRAGLIQSPGHIGLRANLGNALHRDGDPAGALDNLAQAHRDSPQDTIIQRNLANVLRISGQLDKARQLFQEILDKHPEDAETQCLMAFTLLAQGDFGQGWDAYSWRWRSTTHEPARPFTAPHWQGEELIGKPLLVWGEQAVGDELMFANMYPDLAHLGGPVTIETEFRLQPLFKRSFPDFRIVARRSPPDQSLGASTPGFQIAAGDLGRHLRRDRHDFDNHSPYLKPNLEKVDEFRRSYSATASGRKRIGVSWRGGDAQSGVRRSMTLSDLSPLFSQPDFWFVSLQYGDTTAAEAELSALGLDVHFDRDVDPLVSMDDAAAQIASLDGVVSVANTTVHLAGALGVPTWVLLSDTPDWRWSSHGHETPWYRDVCLIRPGADGNSQTTVSEMIARLCTALAPGE